MTRKLMLSTFVLVGCLALAGLSYAQSCEDIHGDPGCAPSPFDGQEVTLTGVVYVATGTYNDGGVYFNCGGGGAGGMTFYDTGATDIADGDEITVTGTVGAFGDEIQLNNATYTINSSGNAYTADAIDPGDLADGTAKLGGFLQATGLLSKVSDGFNSTYEVTDPSGAVIVFVDGTTGIDTALLDVWLGDIVRVSGASKCFGGVGELLPRNQDDFELIEVAEEAQSWGSVKSIYR